MNKFFAYRLLNVKEYAEILIPAQNMPQISRLGLENRKKGDFMGLSMVRIIPAVADVSSQRPYGLALYRVDLR